MFCWKEHDLFSENAERVSSLEDMEGSPMSVQQAYTEMVGKEDLTLERYQVRSFAPGHHERGRLSCKTDRYTRILNAWATSLQESDNRLHHIRYLHHTLHRSALSNEDP